MATSKLRELLQVLEKQGIKEYTESASACSTPASYALLEALIDELEAQRPPEVDARIVTLTAERDSWERQCRNVERGLAETKAEIERLRQNTQSQLVADAELGRLVRKMKQHTSLRCIAPGFYTATNDLFASRSTIVYATKSPAEALRAIQETEE